MPARTVSGEPTTPRRPGMSPDGLSRASRARNSTASSGGGTAISWPRRSSVNVIRLLEARNWASSSVAAAQRPHGDGGPRRLDVADGREVLAVERGDIGALRVDEVGEGVAQPQFAGPDRALLRGAQQPRHRQLRAAGQRRGQMAEGVVLGQVVLEVAEHLAELLGEVVGRGLAAVRWRANVVSGSVPAARPMPRSIRPGNSAARMVNDSATLSGL